MASESRCRYMKSISIFVTTRPNMVQSCESRPKIYLKSKWCLCPKIHNNGNRFRNSDSKSLLGRLAWGQNNSSIWRLFQNDFWTSIPLFYSKLNQKLTFRFYFFFWTISLLMNLKSKEGRRLISVFCDQRLIVLKHTWRMCISVHKITFIHDLNLIGKVYQLIAGQF